MPPFELILNAFVTLFVTIDPISNAPLFVGLTHDMPASNRRATALRGTIVAFFVLVLFALTGTGLLDAMGITIDAFRVAGGLLLFYTAFEMLYGQRQERREQTSESAVQEQVANIAVFPLGIPFIAGPGAISAVILLSSELGAAATSGPWIGTALLIGLVVLILAITCLTLIAAERIDNLIGQTGRLVVVRLLGVLLAALSVQYVADGALALFVP